MKRRHFLTSAAALGALWWLKPGDRGAPHDAYFLDLQTQLKHQGHGRPLLVIDRDRLARNCERVVNQLSPGQSLRIVAKSLPGIALIREVMAHTGSQRLMTFHQPFMNALAQQEPSCDLLLGKPMPVNAARQFYRELPQDSTFNPSHQVQWLIDTLPRLKQYLALAQEISQRVRINIEIDVGLHRGGLQSVDMLDPLLNMIRDNPDYLEFAGLMGYDAHVGKLPSFIESSETALQKSNNIYHQFIQRIQKQHNDLYHQELTFNGAGSPTFRLHDDQSPLNDIAVGSCLIKPMDFDLSLLTDFEPAVFIAAPVLKILDGLTLPGPLPIGTLWRLWDPNRQRSAFIYGGKWMARPVSPAGKTLCMAAALTR